MTIEDLGDFLEDLGEKSNLAGNVASIRNANQTARVRELLEKQEQREREHAALPDCPHCGGKIPKEDASVCAHCSRHLSWVAVPTLTSGKDMKVACKPGLEKETYSKYLRKKKIHTDMVEEDARIERVFEEVREQVKKEFAGEKGAAAIYLGVVVAAILLAIPFLVFALLVLFSGIWIGFWIVLLSAFVGIPALLLYCWWSKNSFKETCMRPFAKCKEWALSKSKIARSKVSSTVNMVKSAADRKQLTERYQQFVLRSRIAVVISGCKHDAKLLLKDFEMGIIKIGEEYAHACDEDQFFASMKIDRTITEGLLERAKQEIA